ncbi:MAG: hypothetical protein AAF621_02130 [Pseudomonadota bacterium]
MIKNIYDICVIDIGSPKLGNLGWAFYGAFEGFEKTGENLDALIALIKDYSPQNGLILGLEAPLFVPLREDIYLATKGRSGEGGRPWSAGAGAQVLAMNLPIMTYLFSKLSDIPELEVLVNENGFRGAPGQIMLFEALVSGQDKGSSHIQDALIMVNYCKDFAEAKSLPPTILQYEEQTEYFNLAAASLLRSGIIDDIALLQKPTPIYKPSSLAF